MVPRPNKVEADILKDQMSPLIPKNEEQSSKGKDSQEAEIDINSNIYPKHIIVWKAVFAIVALHSLALYGLYAIITGQVMWQTIVYGFFSYMFGQLGVCAGSHRLWSHRAYKAKFPLRVFLMIGQTSSYQFTIYDWVRDHRVHHKHSETLADPYNIRGGFFFAHIGWYMIRKNDAVLKKGRTIDMTDCLADPVVRFQRNHYVLSLLLFAYFLPIFPSWYFWGESLIFAMTVSALKLVIGSHSTFLINSVAHLWGDKPYDKSIDPAENKFVSIVSLGEGWHNYHHTFPWDYKADELGAHKYDFATCFIDLMAYFGQAYDLKTVSKKVIDQRMKRTGDGSHGHNHNTDDHNSEKLTNDEILEEYPESETFHKKII